ncbi:uncharacterized protein B0T15DRAFT_489979 [Chaetomium strumarium]|uniref:Uncharacterized protein n=1 Tax=Chaetomium strumarium TaxID=1170767 RepID=A0AAJ0H4F0_9PEZI|nr:hypothetical protein B0T15DRAFT_489979 [Chaetomium strumarium]
MVHAVGRLLNEEWFLGWKNGQEDKGKAPPGPGASKHRPLPEDFALRGMPWAGRYYPDGWFITGERIDDDDKYFKVPSMTEERRKRVLWLGFCIARRGNGKWLHFNEWSRRFGVSYIAQRCFEPRFLNFGPFKVPL